MDQTRVLLTGATGYVGGRLLPLLERDSRYCVRCIARNPSNIKLRASSRVESVQVDLLDCAGLQRAFTGVDCAYFLVHALGVPLDFQSAERAMAENFASAAKKAGTKKIIFLGGLGMGSDLSPHLMSRHEVGEILRASGIVTIEFRASVIIGSGSLSFELIRSLTDKLPIMITPRWVNTLTQPISIENVLQYLLQGLEQDFVESRTFEIGGPDQVPYAALIREYARQRQLKRLLLAVPVLTPRLSSLWLRLVTPAYARVGRRLIDGLRNDTIITDDAALRQFPVEPMRYTEAIARALNGEDHR